MTSVTEAYTTDDALRLRPEYALRPGRRDAAQLLSAWFIRKSAYWLFFVGTIAAHLTDRTDQTSVNWADVGAVATELRSPLAGLVLAAVARVIAGIAGLVMAYRLAVVYEAPLEPRSGFGSGIGRLLDRRNQVYAFRRLRWTHHVRQEALQRLGPDRERVAKLDPILDIVNISTFVLMAVVVITETLR